MPRPVEALPCGSRSTISTRSPMAASAVPRLIPVVALPTPPFWLAIAITRSSAGLAMRLAIATTGGHWTVNGAGEPAGWVMGLRLRSKGLGPESGEMLWPYIAPLHIADDDNVPRKFNAAGHQRGCHDPPLTGGRLTRVFKLKLCMSPLREQAHRTAFPQKRKALVQQ